MLTQIVDAVLKVAAANEARVRVVLHSVVPIDISNLHTQESCLSSRREEAHKQMQKSLQEVLRTPPQ